MWHARFAVGVGHFTRAIHRLPAVFAEWERNEQAMRDYLERDDIAILRDRSGDETKPLHAPATPPRDRRGERGRAGSVRHRRLRVLRRERLTVAPRTGLKVPKIHIASGSFREKGISCKSLIAKILTQSDIRHGRLRIRRVLVEPARGNRSLSLVSDRNTLHPRAHCGQSNGVRTQALKACFGESQVACGVVNLPERTTQTANQER